MYSNFTVWTKDAIDQERVVLLEIPRAKAEKLVENLKGIYPDVPVWMEEE